MIVHAPQSRISRFLPPALTGAAGDSLATAFGRRLDDGYHYFRNLSPGGIETIAAAIVGPGGTWTLAHATERGRFRKRNGHWYRWSSSTDTWIPWDAAQVVRARLSGHRLELYLDRAGLPSAVEPVLITQRGVEIGWELDQRPGVHVHGVQELDRLSTRIGREEVLTPAQVDRIVALLDPRQPLRRLATSSPQS
jgi:hypothetical protein